MLEKIPVEERRARPAAPFWSAFVIAAVVAMVVFAVYLVMTTTMPQDSLQQAPVAVPEEGPPGPQGEPRPQTGQDR